MLGIMLPCWFLSMWMSNTATTAMMVPILGAILHVMRESMTQGCTYITLQGTMRKPYNQRPFATIFRQNINDVMNY